MIGTAGHVDHGKSTLVEVMTGRDPDRWEIEKSRGLTIDLGFSWARLPSGREVSFVDVPGHERYLKNMLAGIEMIDAALLVVAANEGWMQQSEEHLAVLDLLEVDRAVVAITKTDLVDRETVELAMLEIADRLAGTSIEGAALIPVSATEGTGVDDVVKALDAVLPGDQVPGARPRMWIDRVFSVAGAGTVVTGTLVEGPLHVDEEVVILPANTRATVRGLQSHERQVDVARPGTRVAANLRGVSPDQVKRGSMLGLRGQWDLTDRFSASLRAARYAEQISETGAYQLHIGSGAHQVRIDGMIEGCMVARTGTEIPLASGDRFILRDTGRRQVVAGGQILDPAPSSLSGALSTAIGFDLSSGPDSRATRLLDIRGIDSLNRLSAHSGGGIPSNAIIEGATVASRERAEALGVLAASAVDEEHSRYPLRDGVPVATLAEQLGVDQALVERIIELREDLIVDGAVVRRRGRIACLTDDQAAAWRAARRVLDSDLAVPAVADLGLDPEVIHYLVRTGELVSVSSGLVLLPEQGERIRSTISDMADGFTVSEFGTAAGVSRKHSVPFLEWADSTGITTRRGDLRYRRSNG